jgi:hypothetical protein
MNKYKLEQLLMFLTPAFKKHHAEKLSIEQLKKHINHSIEILFNEVK